MKFKTFDDAEKASTAGQVACDFDPDRADAFLRSMAGYIKNPYKAGVYRFRSFEDAAAFDMRLYAEQAAKRRSYGHSL